MDEDEQIKMIHKALVAWRDSKKNSALEKPEPRETREESIERVLAAIRFSAGLSVLDIVDKLSLSERRVRDSVTTLEDSNKIRSYRDRSIKIYVRVEQ